MKAITRELDYQPTHKKSHTPKTYVKYTKKYKCKSYLKISKRMADQLPDLSIYTKEKE